MRNTLLLFVLFVSVALFSQKVKLKKGEILVDKVVWGTYEGCGVFDAECEFIIGSEHISSDLSSIIDPTSKSKSNPDGTVSWKVVKFIGTDMNFEINKSNKKLIKILYNAKVIDDSGRFNIESIEKLVEKYGQTYSRRYYNY